VGQFRQVALNIPFGHLLAAPIPATPYSQALCAIPRGQSRGLRAVAHLLARTSHRDTKARKKEAIFTSRFGNSNNVIIISS